MNTTTTILAVALAGGCLLLAPLLLIAGGRRLERPQRMARPRPRWYGRVRAAARVLGGDLTGTVTRRRLVVWGVIGLGVWVVTGWPVAGVAVVVTGVWLPWLLGSAALVRRRLATLEALESWCRRMADTLVGGGAIGLAQAVTATADRVEDPIRPAVTTLAHRIQREQGVPDAALQEFADAVDDRTGDAVAAALLLALTQQSSGVAAVLRQLADGIARDVRARRDIEAARAESRQSIRMLLLIQAGLLTMLALVPQFSAPYRTPVGQVVMAVLLTGTLALLIWMRRLSLGRSAPRFLHDPLPRTAISSTPSTPAPTDHHEQSRAGAR